MKFIYKNMTQTQLGKLFGVTSHVIGDWLKQLGLRDDDGKPTRDAHEGDFCEKGPSGPTGYCWVWNSEKTVAVIREAGHVLVPNPPHNLVAPAILNGPFSVTKLAGSEFAVENNDRSVSLWANNQMTADVVAKILNIAHKTGVVDRLCCPQRLHQSILASVEEISTVVKPFE